MPAYARNRAFAGPRICDDQWEVFTHDSTPISESHGDQYAYCVGPFRTLADAQYYVDHELHRTSAVMTPTDTARLRRNHPDGPPF